MRRSAPACLALAAAGVLCAGTAAAWDTEWFDNRGWLVRVPVEGGWLACKSELAVAGANWNTVAYLSRADALQSVIGPSGAVWRAALQPEAGVTCRVTQAAHAFSNGVQLAFSVAAGKSNACAGLYFILHLPAAGFAGGSVAGDGAPLRLPEARAVPYVIGCVSGGVVEIRAPRDTGRIRLETPTGAVVQVQDNRRWSDEFAVLVPLHAGPLAPAGETAAALALTGAGRVRIPPAVVQVDAGRVLYRCEGFGGNYVYGLRGGVARTVRATVRPAWARVQVRLDELKRPISREPPEQAFRRQLAAADREGTELHEGLAFQSLLASNGAALFFSLWRAPAWMYTDGVQHESGNVLRDGEWPRLAAGLAAYLAYARDRYGADAEACSLNEPDGGASILVDSNAYPAVVRACGEARRRQGLRARLMLGDVGNPGAAARAWLGPVLSDPVALRDVSWLSFHAWGGATQDEYAAWAGLADRLRLPLVVAEAGVDPDYRRAPVQRQDYAMAEMAQYFALLSQARPQVVLLWEHSDDYPVLIRDADGRLATTIRWGLQRQWCACTPRGSLAVGCDVLTGDDLDACAFLHGAEGAGFTLHLGNRQAARVCRLSGLPAAAASLRVIQTTRDRHARVMGALQPQAGELRLELPAESLTTLTTLAVPDLP